MAENSGEIESNNAIIALQQSALLEAQTKVQNLEKEANERSRVFWQSKSKLAEDKSLLLEKKKSDFEKRKSFFKDHEEKHDEEREKFRKGFEKHFGEEEDLFDKIKKRFNKEKKHLEKRKEHEKLEKELQEKRFEVDEEEWKRNIEKYKGLSEEYENGDLVNRMLKKSQSDVNKKIYGSLGDKDGKIFGGEGFAANMELFRKDSKAYVDMVSQRFKDKMLSPFRGAANKVRNVFSGIKFGAKFIGSLFRNTKKSGKAGAMKLAGIQEEEEKKRQEELDKEAKSNATIPFKVYRRKPQKDGEQPDKASKSSASESLASESSGFGSEAAKKLGMVEGYSEAPSAELEAGSSEYYNTVTSHLEKIDSTTTETLSVFKEFQSKIISFIGGISNSIGSSPLSPDSSDVGDIIDLVDVVSDRPSSGEDMSVIPEMAMYPVGATPALPGQVGGDNSLSVIREQSTPAFPSLTGPVGNDKSLGGVQEQQKSSNAIGALASSFTGLLLDSKVEKEESKTTPLVDTSISSADTSITSDADQVEEQLENKEYRGEVVNYLKQLVDGQGKGGDVKVQAVAAGAAGAGIFEMIKTLWNLLPKSWKESIKKFGKKIVDAIKKPFEWLKNGIKKIGSAIKNVFSKIFGGIKQGISKAFNGLKKFFSKPINMIKNGLSKIGKFFSKPLSIFKSLASKVGKVANVALDAAKSAASAAKSATKATVKVVKNAANATKNAFQLTKGAKEAKDATKAASNANKATKAVSKSSKLAKLGKGLKFLAKPGGKLLSAGVKLGLRGGARFVPGLGAALSVADIATDAIGGVQKAEEWGTSKTSAGIAGAIAGTGPGIGQGSAGDVAMNMGMNALKWGGLGATIGSAILPGVGTAVGGAIGAGLGAITAAIGPERMAKTFDVVGKGLKVAGKGVVNGLKMVGKTAWSGLKLLGNTYSAAGKAGLAVAKGTAKAGWALAKGAAKTAGNAVNAAKKGFGWFGKSIGNVVGGAFDGFKKGGIKGLFSGAKEGVNKSIEEGKKIIDETVSAQKDIVKETVGEVKDVAKETMGEVKDIAKEYVEDQKAIVKDTIEYGKGLISDTISPFTEEEKEQAENASNELKSKFEKSKDDINAVKDDPEKLRKLIESNNVMLNDSDAVFEDAATKRIVLENSIRSQMLSGDISDKEAETALKAIREASDDAILRLNDKKEELPPIQPVSQKPNQNQEHQKEDRLDREVNKILEESDKKETIVVTTPAYIQQNKTDYFGRQPYAVPGM